MEQQIKICLSGRLYPPTEDIADHAISNAYRIKLTGDVNMREETSRVK